MIIPSADNDFGIHGKFVIWDAEYSVQKKNPRKELHCATSSKFAWITTTDEFLKLLSQDGWYASTIVLLLKRFFDILAHNAMNQALAFSSASGCIDADMRGVTQKVLELRDGLI